MDFYRWRRIEPFTSLSSSERTGLTMMFWVVADDRKRAFRSGGEITLGYNSTGLGRYGRDRRIASPLRNDLLSSRYAPRPLYLTSLRYTHTTYTESTDRRTHGQTDTGCYSTPSRRGSQPSTLPAIRFCCCKLLIFGPELIGMVDTHVWGPPR